MFIDFLQASIDKEELILEENLKPVFKLFDEVKI